MNIDSIFAGLTTVTDWIETYIINGLVGGGFQFLKNGFDLYMVFKPLIDIFAALFGMFGAA